MLCGTTYRSSLETGRLRIRARCVLPAFTSTRRANAGVDAVPSSCRCFARARKSFWTAEDVENVSTSGRFAFRTAHASVDLLFLLRTAGSPAVERTLSRRACTTRSMNMCTEICPLQLTSNRYSSRQQSDAENSGGEGAATLYPVLVLLRRAMARWKRSRHSRNSLHDTLHSFCACFSELSLLIAGRKCSKSSDCTSASALFDGETHKWRVSM